MPRDISRETRINLALWRKALRDGGLSLQLKDFSQALAFRLSLYRALKPYRENEFLDPELFEASIKYCVAVPKNTGDLMITERKSLVAAEQIMLDLGLTEVDLLSPEEQMISAKMLDELRGLAIDEEPSGFKPASAPNEFFSRE
jgi:hypothetical protein